jgi:hypothetical protein
LGIHSLKNIAAHEAPDLSLNCYSVALNAKRLISLIPARRKRQDLKTLKQFDLMVTTVQRFITIRIARFFLVQLTHNGGKYTKLPRSIPNVREVCQMAVK